MPEKLADRDQRQTLGCGHARQIVAQVMDPKRSAVAHPFEPRPFADPFPNFRQPDQRTFRVLRRWEYPWRARNNRSSTEQVLRHGVDGDRLRAALTVDQPT